MARKHVGDRSEGGMVVGRRGYLRLGAAAVGIGAVPAVSGGDVIERHGIAFASVADAVDDLGMDPTGEEPVTRAMERVEPDTLVQFPAGEYRIDTRQDLRGLGHVGFEAVGDARIVGAAGFDNTAWNVRESEAVYYAGFAHDQASGSVGHFFRASERIEIHDIDVVGRGGTWGVELSPHITEPDGLARVVNYTNREGSGWANYHGSSGRIGCWLGGEHRGTIRFEDCDFREYGNNALYTSHCPGNVEVRGCYFENNNVASVRIGGEGSFVEDTTIVIDEDRYTGPRENEDEEFFMRGVLIEEHHVERGQKEAGAAIRNAEIVVAENPTGGPAIEIWGNGRSLLVEDTRVRYDNEGVAAIRREGYGPKRNHPPGEPPRWLRLDNCVVTGSGSSERAAIDIVDADGSELVDSVVQLGHGDGIRVAGSADCRVVDTVIDVPGEALAEEDARVATDGVATVSLSPTQTAHPGDPLLLGRPDDSGVLGCDSDGETCTGGWI